VSNRAKLKNLHIFVSPTRLIVHNMTKSMTEKDLTKICLQCVNDKSAKIKEVRCYFAYRVVIFILFQCRIMRDLTQVSPAGVARSRGYAFVEFTEHKHALECLQTMNNNPTLFTDKKVSFKIHSFCMTNIFNFSVQLLNFRSKVVLH
jgi:nucleolar protein 4